MQSCFIINLGCSSKKPFFAILTIGVLASGCALSVAEIDIPYEGKANITVVEGANKKLVQLTSTDERTVYRDRVGAKKNGYGMEMASIKAKNNIAETFQKAVEFELENLGFKIGKGEKNVNVGLVRFYNDFKMGFFAGDSVADGLINLSVKNKTGKLIFTKSYEGGHMIKNIQFATGSNAKEALTGALANIVSKIAQDKDLHAALLQ